MKKQKIPKMRVFSETGLTTLAASLKISLSLYLTWAHNVVDYTECSGSRLPQARFGYIQQNITFKKTLDEQVAYLDYLRKKLIFF